jgi:ubiquitin-like protein Pup
MDEEPRNEDGQEAGDDNARPRNEVDAILDEIDGVTEENAEAFVKSYAQKGGQGWSSFLDPSFYAGAAAAGVVAGATWESFKAMLARITKALRQMPGPPSPSPLIGDETYDANFEYMLKRAWATAVLLMDQRDIGHSIDDATALHWALFFIELQRTLRFVRLRSDHYERITRIAAATPERLDQSQLIAKIIDQWLHQNPNAEIGLMS